AGPGRTRPAPPGGPRPFGSGVDLHLAEPATTSPEASAALRPVRRVRLVTRRRLRSRGPLPVPTSHVVLACPRHRSRIPDELRAAAGSLPNAGGESVVVGVHEVGQSLANRLHRVLLASTQNEAGYRNLRVQRHRDIDDGAVGTGFQRVLTALTALHRTFEQRPRRRAIGPVVLD